MMSHYVIIDDMLSFDLLYCTTVHGIILSLAEPVLYDSYTCAVQYSQVRGSVTDNHHESQDQMPQKTFVAKVS